MVSYFYTGKFVFSFIAVNSSGKKRAMALHVCIYVRLMHERSKYIASHLCWLLEHSLNAIVWWVNGLGSWYTWWYVIASLLED